MIRFQRCAILNTIWSALNPLHANNCLWTYILREKCSKVTSADRIVHIFSISWKFSFKNELKSFESFFFQNVFVHFLSDFFYKINKNMLLDQHPKCIVFSIWVCRIVWVIFLGTELIPFIWMYAFAGSFLWKSDST